MKDKIKLSFEIDEVNTIIKALTFFRNYLSTQERPIEVIDEILLKINNQTKLEFDKYEMGIIINSLNNYRCKLKSINESRSEVNDVLLKLIEETDKKKLILRKI